MRSQSPQIVKVGCIDIKYYRYELFFIIKSAVEIS